MDGLTLRESTDDDVTALKAVADADFGRITGRTAPWSETGLRRMRLVPGRDAGRDFPVVERDGTVVAWGALFANPPYSEIFSPLHLDPDLDEATCAGAVGLLLEHLDGLVAEILADQPADPTRVRTTEILADDARKLRVLGELGYEVDRDEYEMAIELDAVPEATGWPDGVTARPVTGPDDTDLVVDLLADSFSDHPGDLPFTPELVRHVLSGEDLRPAASAVVSDADGPVGLVLCRDRPEAGYVWVVGVRSRARRRGLGAALLRHAFREYALAGRMLVTLDVDGANDSGALEVYRRAGMHVRTRNLVLQRPIAP